jgi:uncharacterized protein
MRPISTNKHVELLDVLRGIAIFGMFTVNMTADIFWGDIYNETDLGPIDFASMVFVNLFTNGKFITIFSFLFGIGFYVQAERKLARGEGIAAFWIRRLIGLLLIAALANALTLPAWILVDYAFLGILLLLFYRLSPPWILMAAIACIAISKIFGSILPSYQQAAEVAVSATTTVLDIVHDTRGMVQREGDFLDVSSNAILHISEEIFAWRYVVANLEVPGLMLLGLYIGRRGAIWDREIQVSIARKTMPWLLGIGFLSCLVWVAMENFGVGDNPSTHYEVIKELAAWPIGMPVLGLGYVAAITLLIGHEGWLKYLSVFAPIGRMALSNYLFTGFVLAFISFQWGLGLYEQVYPAAGLLIAVAILPLQILASRCWLTKFAFGPFEWLWRAWTYGRFPPMRRRPGV